MFSSTSTTSGTCFGTTSIQTPEVFGVSASVSFSFMLTQATNGFVQLNGYLGSTCTGSSITIGAISPSCSLSTCQQSSADGTVAFSWKLKQVCPPEETLSSGAIAGIVVGVLFVFIILPIVVIICCCGGFAVACARCCSSPKTVPVSSNPGTSVVVVNSGAPAPAPAPAPVYYPQQGPPGYPPQGYPPQGYPPQGYPQSYPPK